MANKTKKDNKNLITGICIAAAAVVAIVIAIVFIVRGSGPTLNDDYFKSDDTKYVYTIDADSLEVDDDEESYTPLKAHVVYTYSGDEITGMKTYAEYADAATAEKAYAAMKEADADEAKKAEVNGKYIVYTNDAEDYEGLTASDVKQQIEFMESIQNMNFDDDEGDIEDESDIEDVEIDETE